MINKAPHENAGDQEHLFDGHVSSLSVVQMQIHRKSVNKARTILFYIAGLVLMFSLMLVIVAYKEFDAIAITTLVSGIIMAGTFFSLALWTKSKPYTALLISIIAILAFFLLGAGLAYFVYEKNGLLKYINSTWVFLIAPIFLVGRQLRKARELQQAMQ